MDTNTKMSTHISNIAVLCVEKTHKMYGKVGELTAHDWLDSGTMCVRFADGKERTFPDGMVKGDESRPVERFYRHKNEIGAKWDAQHGSGPEGLKAQYLELNVGAEKDLDEDYRKVFGEPLY